MKRGFRGFLAKALIIFVLIAAIPTALVALEWDGTVADSFESGEGTEANPYIIKTPQQLAYLASLVSDVGETQNGVYFELGGDIDLGGKEWTPIGITNAKCFSGNFDGNGYVISNFKITSSATNFRGGLFGTAKGATIKNVNIVNAQVHLTGNGAYACALVANMQENGLISGCTVDGTSHISTLGNGSIGGLVGRLIGGSVIEYCSNYAMVEAGTKSSSFVGGIAGAIGTGAQINYTVNYGTVQGPADAVGTVESYYAGGIVGCFGVSSAGGSINYCVNKGAVNSVYSAGGLAGRTHTVGNIITNSHNLSQDITGAENFVGTIIGWNVNTAALNDICSIEVGEIPSVGKNDAGQDISSILTVSEEQMSALTAPIYTQIRGNVEGVSVEYPDGVEQTEGHIILVNGNDETLLAITDSTGFTLPTSRNTAGTTIQLLVPYTDGEYTAYDNYIYFVSEEGGTTAVAEQPRLKNLITYEGSAIRTNAELGQGIRFRTSLSLDIKYDDSDEYRILEYGTLAKRNDNPATLKYISGSNDPVAKIAKGMAYNDEIDRIFSMGSDRLSFTNVLIGIDADNYKTDYDFRAYCVVQVDDVIFYIYGPCVTKNIYGIAQQVKEDTEYFDSLSANEQEYINEILGQ